MIFSRAATGRQIIILCVRWYLRFKPGFRDLAETMAGRGISLMRCAKDDSLVKYERSLRARTPPDPSDFAGSCGADIAKRGDLARCKQIRQAAEQCSHVFNSMAKQRGRCHYCVGASQQILKDLIRRVDS